MSTYRKPRRATSSPSRGSPRPANVLNGYALPPAFQRPRVCIYWGGGGLYCTNARGTRLSSQSGGRSVRTLSSKSVYIDENDGDIGAANVMMDGRSLYPDGHHPVRLNYSPDGIFEITPLSRTEHPVRYYFIDFGLSSRFREGEPHLVLGRAGRDKQVPELSHETPYDAYKVDVFALGNLYYKELISKYHGLDFLQPLIDSMKHQQPDQRPTADAARIHFYTIYSKLDSPLLRWRLSPRTESTPERVVYDTVAVAKEGIYQLKRLMS